MKINFKGLIEHFNSPGLDFSINGNFELSNDRLEGKIIDERISKKEKIIKGYFHEGIDNFYLNFLILSKNKNSGKIVYRFYNENNSIEGKYEGICNKLPLEIPYSQEGSFYFWHSIMENIDLGNHIYFPKQNKPITPYGIVESRAIINLKKL